MLYLISLKAQDERGMIAPDVVFYERRPSTSVSMWSDFTPFDEGKEESATVRDNEVNFPIPRLSQLRNSRKNSIEKSFKSNESQETDGDTYDTMSQTCETRMSTPLRPLNPAYHANDAIHVTFTNSSSGMEDGFVLPPGYITTQMNTAIK